MKKASGALVLMTALLLAAPFVPLGTSKSTNPCSNCHDDGRYMFLDILEGDPGNTIPGILNDSETLMVAAVVEVTCDVTKNNMMTAISATLSSQNGYFSVAVATFSIGALGNGQRATAFWNITPLAEGSDVLVITAQGHNNHKNLNFNDAYMPAPAITVHKIIPDLPPSIALTAPASGAVLTGGSDVAICWTVTDEDKPNCLVSLYYSTDDFASVNQTIATGVPATQGYTWTAPLIDSSSVRLKATVTDKTSKFNQTLQGGTFSIDSTLPSILSVSPADKDDNVTESAAIMVNFSEPVVTSTALAAFSISPDPGGLSWSWNPQKTTMTATHSPFASKTNYTCTMASGVKDMSSPGNIYPGTLQWNFSTTEQVLPVPSINISSPAGGERLYWGDHATARWTASGGTGTLAINLSISENGTSGPFMPLVSNAENNGQYAFTVPHLVSGNCIIKATVFDSLGMESQATSGTFAIAQDITLSAVLPAAGSSLRAKNTTAINWTGAGGHGTVTVNVSFIENSSSSPQTIFSNKPLTGSVQWTVPLADSDSARIVLNATDDWGRSLVVTSEPFTVFTNRLPSFDSKAVLLGQVAVAYAYTARAVDADGDSLTFSLVKGPGGMAIDFSTGKVTWTPALAGSFNVTLNVSDGHGGEALQEFTVSVAAKVMPKVTIGALSTGQKVKGTINITGTTTKGTLNITKVQLRVDSGDWMDATGSASWQLTLDTTKLKNGKHTLVVRAFDGTDYSDMVNGTLTVDNAKARNKVSVPMLDGLMVMALFAIVGTLFTIRRKR